MTLPKGIRTSRKLLGSLPLIRKRRKPRNVPFAQRLNHKLSPGQPHAVELHENLDNEDGNGSPDDNPILANYPSVPQNLGKPFELPFIPYDPLGGDSSSSSSSSSDDEDPAADPAADPAVPPDAAWDEDAPNPLVIPNWLVLWALYLSNGTTACTESNYAIIRNLLSLAFRCPQLYWRAPEQTFLALQPIGRLSGRASFPSYSTIWLRTRLRRTSV